MKKTDLAWSAYDFANSAYALVVMTLFYPLFFIEHVAVGENGQATWGIAVSISLLLVAITAPIIGSLSDGWNNRKILLRLITILLPFLIAGIAFSGNVPHTIGILMFIVTNAFFGLALFLYDSQLIDARPTRENITFLSGIGWAIGYIGGPLCVLIIYFVLKQSVPETLEEYRLAFLIVAVFFALIAIPSVFLMSPEVNSGANATNEKEKLLWLFRTFKHNKHIITFLAAIYLVSDGLITVVYFISIYSKEELGLSLSEIVFFLTVVQLVGIFATIFFSYLAQKVGEIRILILCALIWCMIVVLLYSTKNPDTFYLIALLTGLVVGSTPAIARGYLARITPTQHRAEVFGFNAFASRFASIIGPLIFVVISAKYGMRPAMLSIIPFFLLGMVLLFTVQQIWSDSTILANEK